MNTKNILIVIDVQNDFIYGNFSTKQAQNIIKNIYEEIRNSTVHYDEIIFTKDTHSFQDFSFIEPTTFEGVHFEKHCIRDTSGWDIVFPIKDCSGEVILKDTFDGSKRIIDYLVEEYNLDYGDFKNNKFNFYICGVCTDICVLATAIGLIKYDYTNTINVLTDLCAGTSSKAHKTAVAAMKPYKINTTTTKNIAKKKKRYAKYNKENKNDKI